MTKRVALYGRHSSTLQNPKSASVQIESIRDEVSRRFPDWEIVYEERDEAVSGTSLEGRDGLARLVALAEQEPPPFEAILVEDVTRFARNHVDSVTVRAHLRGFGVEVLSQADNFSSPDDDSGLLITRVKEAMAEISSRDIGRKVLRGNKGRVREGFRPGSKPPFGYVRVVCYSETEKDIDGNRKRLGVVLEPDELSAQAVEYMFRRYAEGAGQKTIARELNEGPLRAAKPDGYKPGTIRDLLQNPVYIGWLCYPRTTEKRTQGADRKVRRRKVKVPIEDQEIHKGAHEAIIEKDLWDRVQERFAQNQRRGVGFGAGKRRPRGGKRPVSLLTGLVRCSLCGGNFIIWTSGPNTRQRRLGTGQSQRRFVCSSQRNKRGCTNARTFEAGSLERSVLDVIQERVVTESGMAYLFECRKRHLQAALDGRGERIKGFEARRRELREQEARITEAVKAGLMNDTLIAENERVVAEGRLLDRELAAFERLAARRDEEIERHVVRSRVQRLSEVLDAPNLDGVRRALVDLVETVEVREDGSCWLLVGEGPLGTQDLLIAPQGASGDGSVAMPEMEPATQGEQQGSTSGSLVRVVGATGFEPATSCSRSLLAMQRRGHEQALARPARMPWPFPWPAWAPLDAARCRPAPQGSAASSQSDSDVPESYRARRRCLMQFHRKTSRNRQWRQNSPLPIQTSGPRWPPLRWPPWRPGRREETVRRTRRALSPYARSCCGCCRETTPCRRPPCCLASSNGRRRTVATRAA